MSQALFLAPPRRPFDGGRAFLTAAFFVFCYVLLTWRAQLLNEAAPFFSDRRALALAVGAGVFWTALGQIGQQGRMTLARVASWIVLGTIAVLVARLAVNWWKPDTLLTLGYSLRWALAWAAYFGLWLMGAVAFRRARAADKPVARVDEDWVKTEQLDWLVDALLPELSAVAPEERARAADRLIRRAGTYELADALGREAAEHNSRVHLAYRVAMRLRGDD